MRRNCQLVIDELKPGTPQSISDELLIKGCFTQSDLLKVEDTFLKFEGCFHDSYYDGDCADVIAIIKKYSDTYKFWFYDLEEPFHILSSDEDEDEDEGDDE